MPVADTDLVVYAAANMPDADSGTNGGAIDTLRRVQFTQIAANDTIRAVSTSASDTGNMTVTARNAGGQVVTETKALTGTTAITFSTLGTVERVLKVDMSANAVGTVTVARTTGPTTIAVIPVGERGFYSLFAQAASDVSGGSSRDFYRKVFVKNTHATLAALGLAIAQSADPDARITHAVATALNDTVSATDRKTAPSGVGTFDDTSKSITGTDLAAGATIAVWLKLTLPAGDAPHRSTYTLALNFSTA